MRRRASSQWRRFGALAFGLAALASFAAPARAAEPRFSFAVISSVMKSAADEPLAQRLIDAIGLDQRLSFVVYDGNIKGTAERCGDALFDRRQQLLAASAIPLILLPGQHDWADCASASGGGYDAAERLDFLRQTLYSDTSSLGRSTLSLTRESEVARFRAFRENVRWEAEDTVFVGLNVVGGNNHYSDAGGRNGEFDDRAIASAFWLEHAAEYAKRRRAKALVVFVEADPNFSRYEEHTDRFPWLRFARRRKPDGYLEFKRSLVNAARTFRGPIVLIHHDSYTLARGFSIDQPLFNDKGERVANLTRIAIAPRDATTQWIVLDVNYARPAPFRVSVRVIPKTLPVPPAAPAISTPMPASAIGTPGPAIEPLPGIQYVLPAPPASTPPAPQPEPPLLPDTAGSGSAPRIQSTPASPASSTGSPAAPDDTAPGAKP
ncbi:hypothetical protein AB1286_00155 [Trinickia sp. NRRL B-1857]|uniref:hypothetical protein n=1 Tax=Trinickia sp. NRRL B-1857 TaxID=3162879 RepID=UPI003D2CAC9C